MRRWVRELAARLAAMPERVPVNAIVDEAEIVKLTPEARHPNWP